MAEFTPEILKIIERNERTAISAENAFYNELPAVEKMVYDELKKLFKDFNTKDGKIEFDAANVDIVNQVDERIKKAIKATQYSKAAAGYLRNFETLKENNVKLHTELNGLDAKELDKLVNPIQKAIVEQTLQGLTGTGVSTNFIEPVREGIYKNIVAGATIADLENALQTYILGNPNVNGLFSRYVKQVSRDALNQFDGQVNARIAEENGLDAFRYVGSLIDDSRPQCRRWVSMGVLQKEDLPAQIAWAQNNGTGMIPGTNAENFAVYRGGYNCRHAAIPFKLTKSQREKLNMPEEQQKIEAKAEKGSAEIGTPRAVQDFNNLFGFQSSKTPRQLKGMPGLPEILFEYSDNGKMKEITQSYYKESDGIVRLGYKGTRYAMGNEAGKLKVAVHEYAHRTHYTLNKIVERRANGTWVFDVDAKTNDYWEKSVKLFEDKLDDFKAGKRKTMPSSLVFDYKDKFPQFTQKELGEFAGAYSDTIQAVSKCRFGSGHDVKYMLDYNQGLAKCEWFAHAFENYFTGNPIFQLEFPELYELMNEYVFEDIIKPNTPKNLLK
jgi:hypothetical protein